MNNIGLLKLRERLKKQLSEVESVIDALNCTYCHSLMDCAGEPVAIFMDGVDYSAIRSSTEYQCPRCGQAVEIVEESENKRRNGKWQEIDHHIWVNIRRRGEPFITIAPDN